MRRFTRLCRQPARTGERGEITTPYERFTDLFDKHQMHIAARNSRTRPAAGKDVSHLPTFYIQIPAHHAIKRDVTNIKPAFKELCTELNAQGTISVINYPL